ncbi:uncharacterized protein [Diabrotica undecimpunctata]|uniref:uncharacterized protein n=1 Tax=Diabrotica undecimpunctata TaxID=50387 RepID=UPI003B636B92
MSLSWTNEETFKFIELYQSQPSIWDPKNELHKDKNKVIDAWNHIADTIQIPVSELKKKKESLMAAFRMNFKRKQDSIRSGMRGEEIYKPVWIFYDAMEVFLRGIYKGKPIIEGESNSLGLGQKTATSGETREQEIGISNGAKANTETNNTKVPIPVRRRREVRLPDLEKAEKEVANAFNTLNQIMLNKEQKIEDDCDLYGRLFANKLRKYSEIERQEIMYEIDGLLLRRLQNCSSNSVSSQIIVDKPHASSSAASYVCPSPSSPYLITRPLSSNSSHNSEDNKSMLFENEILPKLEPVENSNEATNNEDSNEDTSVTHDVTTTVETELDEPDTNQEDQSLDQDVLNKVHDRITITRLRCETCNLSFSDKNSFTVHNRKHEKTKCDICSRLVRSDNMKRHIRLHTAGPSVCSICGATFKNFDCLRCHVFHYHKHTAQQYICEECGRGFRMKHSFVLHKKKVHMGLKNFKCSTCGKAFFTNTTLLKHVRMTHEKLRPHVCEYCSTGFSSTYALKTHKRQHTNEKPFICYYCSEGFKQRVSLRSHLKSKHGIEEAKEFFCKTCEKGFATNYALSIHERLHETQKCEICSENFAEGEYLTNHLREVHQLEVEIKQDS